MAKSYYSRPQRNPCLVSIGSAIRRRRDHAESARPPSPLHLVHSPGRHLLWRLPDHRSPAPKIWRGRDSESTLGRSLPLPCRACGPLPPGGHRGSDPGAGGDRRQSPAPGGHRRSTLAAPTLGCGSSLVAPVPCFPRGPLGNALDPGAVFYLEIFEGLSGGLHCLGTRRRLRRIELADLLL
jgi:hypothetical protein